MTTVGATDPDLRYLRSHRLARLLPADVRAVLRNVAGHEAPAVWAEACAEAGVNREAELASSVDMTRLTAALATRRGAVGLVGRALHTRVTVFDLLAARYVGVQAPPADWARSSLDLLLQSRLQSPSRTAELSRLDLFGPATAARAARTARAAAAQLGTPIGLVTAVLDQAQEHLGTHGLPPWFEPAHGLPIEWSFCATTVRTRQPHLVHDLAADVLQRTNPLVVHEGARSYAGVPLLTRSGEVLGTVCVIDLEPRRFAAGDVAALRALADEAVAELEERAAPAA
ncbi:GAF domain-containing protein [Modestobacter sp. I12A-02628]|uniref:GAF domain-containing protein n=1 Tax=Goekera deserti TaxID=2497753 RepID=A0A7K3WHS8_9ACTN|nr:GAF domain-containing protein [Goekera deserti]MPQ97792.1 GAF domain-containing protein [Goekera deserti]NDI48437.1 GAF domain-containing protein [Goekera deserti]NEL56038.1 GAF domain-containing protein [Goekera deserti]